MHLLRFKSPVEVASQMEQPRILRANFGADKADALFPVPVRPPRPPSPHFRFEFHRMVVRFRDAADDAAIPRVAVASLGEDGRVTQYSATIGFIINRVQQQWGHMTYAAHASHMSSHMPCFFNRGIGCPRQSCASFGKPWTPDLNDLTLVCICRICPAYAPRICHAPHMSYAAYAPHMRIAPNC